MPKNFTVENEPCLNCGDLINGSYCRNCGQKAIDNIDRSMMTLLGGFIGNLFFLDNRFFISLKYMIMHPGQMTIEFLNGRRKKFLPPVTLFLFVNLIYFFLSPITDYSLSLYDQMNYQFYSETATEMVNTKIDDFEITMEDYTVKYEKSSDNISKTIMILNVPLIAMFVYLASFRSRKFYFDSLVFSFHFFTLFLFSVSIGNILSRLFPIVDTWVFGKGFGVWLVLFILIIPLVYGAIYFKHYINTRWIWGVLGGLYLIIALIGAQLIYRAIIFFLTYYAT